MACSAYKYYSDLEARFGDQFYLFDRTCLIENIHMFKTAFSSAYPRVTISHSYKTNYTPQICQIAKEEGLHAEVVSGEEYDIALQAGYPPEEIIFNGPIKTFSDLENALLQGSMVNVDHLEETRQVVAISTEYPDTRIKVGIRCNADFGSPLRSRFGMSEDHGELQAAFELLRNQPNISVVGIHIHTSAIRSPESYQKRSRFAAQLIKKYFQAKRPEYIDMGGGFTSMMPPEIRSQLGVEQTDFKSYAQALCGPLNTLFDADDSKPMLILEPGLALFANVFKLCTKVLATKRIGTTFTAILSGSIHTVKPTGHSLNMPVTHIPADPEKSSVSTWELTGYTCMEHDVIYKDFEGAVSAGDYFIFDQVGAYTTVFKPPFIKGSPPIIEDVAGKIQTLRSSETLTQMLGAYS